MSMYLDLLSTALDGWVGELTGAELVSYARTCRDALANPGTYGLTGNAAALAAEIAYDRALIALCRLLAIEVDARAFLFPDIARRHIEAVLRLSGIALEGALPSPPPEPQSPPA